MIAENQINLATEADFTLGKLSIRPSLREIANGGDAETLEPRVMQVLVALARRHGQVVSRDQLVTLCWEGRAVGEDAIQRAIAKVRKLAEMSGAFHIDTVARVGYRLRVEGQAAVTPATSVASEPVLAVLPFDNLSDDREMQFFADGVSEEILHAIAHARSVKVIGRMSAFEFRGPRKAEAAHALNATHVLDGSVRRAGNRIRVSAQLIEAREKTSLWGEQFDRDVGDALQLQSEIATAIAAALQLELEPQPPPSAIDSAAYDLWLRARGLGISDFTDESAAAAATLLEQAVARAPTFARAWACLAGSRASLLSRERDTQHTPEHDAALAAAERALSIDPGCGDALRALAFLKPAFAQHAEKLSLFERALAIAPSDVFATFGYASALVSVGRVAASLPYFRLSLQLEPASPPFAALYAAALCASGDVDHATALVDQTWERFPSSLLVWFNRMWMSGVRGGTAANLAHFADETPLRLGVSQADIALFRSIHSVSQMEPAVRAKAIRNLLDPAAPALWIGLCKLAAELGCADEAFEALFAACKSGRPIIVRALGNLGMPRALHGTGLFYHDAKKLRNDPRFADVCARLGFAAYWTSSGHWPDCAAEVPYDFRAECKKALAALR